MATNTSRLGLLKKDPVADGNDTFNIKTMLNDNWDKIDAKVATLGADGKVPAEQLSISVSDASTTQKGVVMLEDSVTSTSILKAATPNSVKTVSDALDAHKTDLVSHGIYGTATGTNTLVMTNSNITSYVEGMLVAFKTTTSNTGAVTLNINSLGAKTVKKANGNALSSGNLKADGIYQLRYDGNSFILLGEGGEYGNAASSDVLSGKTFGTENGLVTGTLTLDSLGAVKKASGLATSGGTNKSFINESGNIASIPYLIVNGIGFTPKSIHVYQNSNGSFGASVSADNTVPLNNGYNLISITSSSNIRLDGSVAYLADGSFCLPVSYLNTDYRWVAYA